jgi:predicted transcriptional regulator
LKKNGFKYLIDSSVMEALNISHGEIAVFAVIDSITKGREGLYYGSQHRLAEITGYSHSTVKRAIKGLLRLGYIERCEINNKKGFRSCKIKAEDRELPSNDAEQVLPPAETIEKEGLDVREILAENFLRRPKYEFHAVGNKGLVCMTAEQYKNLMELVSTDVLNGYISRLENLIIKKKYRSFSHYETVRSWILKDAEVQQNR